MKAIFRQGVCNSCFYECGQYCSCRYLESIDLATGSLSWTINREQAIIVEDENIAYGLKHMGYIQINLPGIYSGDDYFGDCDIPFEVTPIDKSIITKTFISKRGKLFEIGRSRFRRKKKKAFM